MTRRVFVVDDSAFVRRALTRILDRATGYHVVGEAADAVEALERIPALDPDLVTLDVAMPGMDGLQLLRALLRWNPRLRVLMLSAHTRQGAAATVEALSAGAVDFIDKSRFNVMDLESLRREVLEKMDACARRAAPTGGARTPGVLDPAAAAHCAVCVIGASTGVRPRSSACWSRSRPAFRSPSWWCSTCRWDSPGRSPIGSGALPAGGGRGGGRRAAHAGQGADRAGGRAPPDYRQPRPGALGAAGRRPSRAQHRPHDEIRRAARPGRVLGILLTGMGEDGAEGMQAIRAGGGLTIAESEASCVVYGMSRAAWERGGATSLLPLPEIVGFLARLTAAFPAGAAAPR